jgi:hypothetical protein
MILSRPRALSGADGSHWARGRSGRLVQGQSIRESIDQVLKSSLHLVVAKGLLLFLQLSDVLGPAT